MHAPLLRICCVLFIIFPFGSDELEIAEFAVPSSVEAGENAELQCKYELDGDDPPGALFVKWWWSPHQGDPAAPDGPARTVIYQRIAGQEPQTLHFNITVKEDDTIVLLDLEPEDSGRFECEVSDIDEVRQYQDMIVYSAGSGPQLNVTLTADGPDEDEAEDVAVACEARDAAPLPDLAITLDGEVLDTDEVVSGPDRGRYDITANATVSAARAANADIRCELFYADENISHPVYMDTLKYEPAGDAGVKINFLWTLILGCVPVQVALLRFFN